MSETATPHIQPGSVAGGTLSWDPTANGGLGGYVARGNWVNSGARVTLTGAGVYPALDIASTGLDGFRVSAPFVLIQLVDTQASGETFNLENGRYVGTLGFYSNTYGSAVLSVSRLGRVGVNTYTPTEALDVVGAVKATGYKASDGSAGVTADIPATATLHVKNGIITGWT